MNETLVLVALLRDLYDEAEAYRWLTSPQALFDGHLPLDMIADGRTDDLVTALRQLIEGVYQ